MNASGVSVGRSVSPGWPLCPPGSLPKGCRRLITPTGFFSPSLDGGLRLLLLFSPEPTLQFGNACLHRRHLGRMACFLRQQQGDEVALRQLLKCDVVLRHLGSSLVNQILAPEPPSSDGTTAE
jgi:hypothetical protein